MDINSDLKNEIMQYKRYLSDNPDRWFVDQVKHSMLTGKRYFKLSNLNSKQCKKMWFPKKINKHDLPYYDKNTNILVIEKQCRKNIDFIKTLNLGWCAGIEWDNSLFSVRRYTLNIVCF